MSSYEYRTSETSPHLGGNIRGGDPVTHAPLTWKWMIGRFGVRSAVDLGSGEGHCALYLHRRGVMTIAVDGLAENVASAVYPTVLHDITDGPFISDVDLVYCCEVVEHISIGHLPKLMNSFQSGRHVVISHARPDQPGHHHVNCQTSEWWIDRFESYGFKHLQLDSTRLRAMAHMDGAHHLGNSGLVFRREYDK